MNVTTQPSHLHPSSENTRSTSDLNRKNATEARKHKRYIYFGDSRARHFHTAHVAQLNVRTESSLSDSHTHLFYDNSSCENNTYRYSHADFCARHENTIRAIENARETLFHYNACWRTELRCFQLLSNSVTSAQQLLNVSDNEDVELMLHFGLHNLVHGMSEHDFCDHVAKAFANLSLLRPRIHVTWLSTYPLIEPAPGKVAKFSDYAEINEHLKSVTSKTNELALSHGFQVFDASRFITSFSSDLSPDTVHLHTSVDFFLAHELLSTSTLHPALDLLHSQSNSFSDFAQEDLFCGTQKLEARQLDQTVHVALLGSSITSDIRLMNGFKDAARERLNWTVQVDSLGDPAKEGSVQSLCWEQSASRCSKAHIVFIEYCSNSTDTHTSALRRIILQALNSPNKPYVVYYCHYGPQSRLGRWAEKDWTLAQSLGITAVRNLFLLSNLLIKEEPLFYRDKFHLTSRGGYEIGNLLARAVQSCAASPVS